MNFNIGCDINDAFGGQYFDKKPIQKPLEQKIHKVSNPKYKTCKDHGDNCKITTIEKNSDFPYVNDGTCDYCQDHGHRCQCHFKKGCSYGLHKK